MFTFDNLKSTCGDLSTMGQNSTLNHLYKYKGKHSGNSIKERREKCLEEQKERRHRIMDSSREQFELFIKTPIEDESEPMEVIDSPSRTKVKKFKFKLMKTEWFTDVPDDLEQKWLIKCVPEGYRVMLVSKRRQTICYNKEGKIILKLRSNFSGGYLDHKSGTTVLDCIYNNATKTLFILDCLCWNDMSMIDSEAEFRFFWMKSKFREDLKLSYCKNYSFVLIDYMPAEFDLIQNAMLESFHVNDKQYYYDGVVFYHKQSHYYFGKSPLVGWLSSFMLTELLHIAVSQEHLIKKPVEYKCFNEYIQNLKKKKKRKSVKNTKEKMEIS